MPVNADELHDDGSCTSQLNVRAGTKGRYTMVQRIAHTRLPSGV